MPGVWPSRSGVYGREAIRHDRRAMLIVTNGTSAVHALERAGIPGAKLPWDDVLHDGPIPGGLSPEALATVRARHIADCGWGTFEAVHQHFSSRDARLAQSAGDDEVLLWFEHDLYDQLQLIQVLERYGPPERRPAHLSLVCHARFVSLSSDDQLRADFARRTAVSETQIGLAVHAWTALRAARPEPVLALLSGQLEALPFLGDALERFLEELPGRDGLARSERQILAAVADGAREVREVLAVIGEREPAPYLGDASVALYTQQLARGPAPLLREDDGALTLTEIGLAVLEGREDRIRVNGVHRWWGGTRLEADRVWRWDPDRRALRPPKRPLD